MGRARQGGSPALTECAGGSALGGPPGAQPTAPVPAAVRADPGLRARPPGGARRAAGGGQPGPAGRAGAPLTALGPEGGSEKPLRATADPARAVTGAGGWPLSPRGGSSALGRGTASPRGPCAWVRRVQPHLAAMRHPPASVLQLLSAEILHHRGLVERLLGVADPLLRSCPEPLQQHLQVSGRSGAAPGGAGGTWPAMPCPRAGSGHPASCVSLQPSVQALRERAEQLFVRSGACAVQLEHAQSLLAQFAEAHAELLPWLEETQAVGVQLSPNAISYEAFKEQQALLQVRDGEGAGIGSAELWHPVGVGARWAACEGTQAQPTTGQAAGAGGRAERGRGRGQCTEQEQGL